MDALLETVFFIFSNTILKEFQKTTNTMEDTNKVNWNDVQGNPFRVNLHRKMLTDEGYEYPMNGALRGEPKGNVRQLSVNYNRDYVRKYLINKVIEKLQFPNYNELQKFIAECWHERKNKW